MPNAVPDGPLTAITPDDRARFRADLGRLLETAGLAADAPIGVALSGGPDSCALLLLAVAGAGGPVQAMTVDHGLRASAATEAEAAAALCRHIGVPHRIARVSVTMDGTGIQAAAREARYAALAAWASTEGLAAVLTAHHADDQAETLLMRLARGAGLSGLTGIRPVRPLSDGVALLRPLLGWRKAALEAIVAAAGIVPARDPSNADSRFDRTAARALLAQADWLDPLRLAAAADHLRDSDAALEAMTDNVCADALAVADGVVELRPDAPREVLRRALERLFRVHFGARPDGPALLRLMATLAAGGTATLAGVQAHGGAVWRFRPAPPRRSSKQSG